jgi:hypothetical protein
LKTQKRQLFEQGGRNDGEFKLAAVVQDIVNKAENTALEEREACAKVCENIYEGDEGCGDWPTPEMCAEAIRARGDALTRLNKAAEDNGEEL